MHRPRFRTSSSTPPFAGGARAVTLALAAAVLACACGSEYSLETTMSYDGVVARFTKDAGSVKDAKSKDTGAIKDGFLVDQAQGGTADYVQGESDEAGDSATPGADGCSQACAGDGDCAGIVVGTCQQPVCESGCCIGAVAEDGSPCDDGLDCTSEDTCAGGLCAGLTTGCDDALDCTNDKCDAETGKCTHAAAEGWCAIDGTCVEDGADDPNNPCQWCSIPESQSAWVWKPSCCKADSECPAIGACDVAFCDAATGKCMPKKKLGCCSTDGDCDDANACTTDACNQVTGNCVITAKACEAFNNCQNGECDPGSGACMPATKPGWCFVGGQCVVDGQALAGNGCMVCDPAKSAAQWSPAAGAFCDDGNSCTFADVCGADGQCKGTAQAGCCKNDGDCGAPSGVCQTVTCDAAFGLCKTANKAGCCTSGVCCDTNNHTAKPANSPCADTILASEYKCDGAGILRRDTVPGCDGSSATACTSNPALAAVTAWATIKTCAAGSVCEAAGSGQMPACKTTLTGSCAGSCGGKSKNGTCFCDGACKGAGDCCTDFASTCSCTTGVCCDTTAKIVKAKGTNCGSATYKTQWQCSGANVQKRTGQQTCSGAGSTCSTADGDLTWSVWSTTQACASGTVCTVAADGSSASCKSTGVSGTCGGGAACGGQGSGGSCYCDEFCKTAGDCCSDYVSSCCKTGMEATGACSCGANPSLSCSGKCGGQGGVGCWCDDACEMFGDCCADKPACGCL